MSVVTVLARFMGDSSSLKSSAATAGAALAGTAAAATTAGATVGKRAAMMKAVVGSQFGEMARQTGGEMGAMVSQVTEGFAQIGEHATSMGSRLMAAGAVTGGLGAALQMAASGDVQGAAQLKAAIEASGHSFDEYEGSIDKVILKMENLGHTTPETQQSLQILTAATNDPAKALKMMSLVADLAASKHISLADSAKQVARVINGTGNKILMQYGVTMVKTSVTAKALVAATKAHGLAVAKVASVTLKYTNLLAIDHAKKKLTIADEQKLKAAHDAVGTAQAALKQSTVVMGAAQERAKKNMNAAQAAADQLAGKLRGQASAAVTGFGGRISVLKAHLADWTAQIGQKLGPALTMIGPALLAVGAIMDIVRARQAAAAAATVINTEAEVAQAGASKIAAAGQWLLNAALSANPIALVIIAIVALVAALILAWRHSETFRKIVTAAFDKVMSVVRGVIDWVKGHWPLLLGILTGPFGLAVLWVAQHWGAITGTLGKVKDALGKAWSKVTDVLTAPFKAAVALIEKIMGPVLKIIDKVTGFLGGAKGANASGIAGSHVSSHQVGKAIGGPVRAGIPYWVGERGKETFVPSVNGTIIPHGSALATPMRHAALVGSGAARGGTQVIEARIVLEGTGMLAGLRKEIRVRGGNTQVVLGT